MSKRALAEREANVVWNGGLVDGSGTIETTTSGAIGNLAVSWADRTGEGQGATSPEELLAAAHASCYAMAFSYELANHGATPEKLEVSAKVGFDPKVGGGFEVSFSELTVTGHASGVDAETFEKLAQAAAVGCPISAAMKGNVEVTVHSTLA